MFHVVLFEPEIPANTGNIIRLCANTGAQLHLIRPYGFTLDDKRLHRAGLDYHEWTSLRQHVNYTDFLEEMKPSRIFACSTKASTCYTDVNFIAGDMFLFGPETRGLPDALLSTFSTNQCLRIPMLPQCRSLNLANAASVILYEAWRQQRFSGCQSIQD